MLTFTAARRQFGWSLALFATALFGQTPVPEPAPLAPDGGVIYRAAATSIDGIVYGEAGGRTLTLDYYPPAGPGPHPAVILIHGGWYHANSKAAGEVYPADFLAPAGYAVFAINFRPAPPYTLADQIADVHQAIRFVRAHATTYALDPARLALWGGSAGAYRGNMAALTAPDDATRVQAVISMYGIEDLRSIVARPWLPGRPTADEWKKILGLSTDSSTPIDEAAAASSPFRHLSRNAPPFLLIHGSADEAVGYEHSVRLHRALLALGVASEFITIPDGLHTTVTWHRLPNVPDWERQALLWLNRTLRHDGPIGEGIRNRVQFKQGSR